MRALFTTQPGVGHLYPLLPVAAGLRERGHQVAFAASRSFCAEVEAFAFTAFAAGRDWVTADMAQAFPEMTRLPPGPARYAWARRSVFGGETARDSVPDLLTIAHDWRPDLIVREAAEYGGCLAAELLDLPHAVVSTDSGSSWYSERHHVAEPLASSRAHYGLPPDPGIEMPFRYLQVSFAPAGLGEPAGSAAPTLHDIRPVEARWDGGGPAPAWLADLGDRPTVYATLGTVYNGMVELFRAGQSRPSRRSR